LDFEVHLRVYVRGKERAEDAQKDVDKALREFDYEVDGVYDLRLGLAEI